MNINLSSCFEELCISNSFSFSSRNRLSFGRDFELQKSLFLIGKDRGLMMVFIKICLL